MDMGLMYRIISRFYNFFWRTTKVSRSFSSDGEDLIMNKIFYNKRKGYYVDIGAFAPIRFNNTFLFYLRGWRGVLIDPRPGFRFWARVIRPRDEVFNIGIDPDLKGNIRNKKLYIYDSYPDNNTMSEERVAKNLEVLDRKHSDELNLRFAGFEYIINNSIILKNNIDIDVLNIDIEGFEYEVIKSIICDIRILPKVICVEQISMDCKNVLQTNIYKTLSNNGYILLSKTMLSSIYVRKEFMKNNDTPYFDNRLRA